MQLFDLSHYYLLQGIYDGVASLLDGDSTLVDTLLSSYTLIGNIEGEDVSRNMDAGGEGLSVFSSE